MRRPLCVSTRARGSSSPNAEGAIKVVDAIAATVDDPEAHLRASLAGAMMMGIAAQRYLLRMPHIADAGLEDVLRLAEPAIRAVIAPTA
ncbi:hypothetical protein [Actinoplanes rectilineatus]|uniref:TetR/AcrR family transcriptional regulator n=1 Tax=Actinoplanes rectilineatus TaxID=113571 RepID=UPI0012F78086|nr:hypothetical protein [Actinoplanes rectilineatus]